jgi:hypothetical protein
MKGRWYSGGTLAEAWACFLGIQPVGSPSGTPALPSRDMKIVAKVMMAVPESDCRALDDALVVEYLKKKGKEIPPAAPPPPPGLDSLKFRALSLFRNLTAGTPFENA